MPTDGDSWAIDSIAAVQDALALAGGYDHVSLHTPARDELTLTLNMGGTIVGMAHGHQFDPIESLSRSFKEFFARGATERVPPTPRSMLEATNPHWKPEAPDAPPPKRPGDRNSFLHWALRRSNPLPLDRAQVNVVPYIPVQDPARAFVDSFGGPARKPTVDGPRQTFFTDIAWYSQQISQSGGKDVRLVIIGHTHHARIVRGTRPDGTLFVLMDCGAWVDTSCWRCR